MKNIIALVITILLVSMPSYQLSADEADNDEVYLKQYKEYINKIVKENAKTEKVKVREYKTFDQNFTVTAYDLSVQSCGKKMTSRGYGITRTGYDLRGKDWRTAKVIAVDSKIIPLKSVVYVEFIEDEYKIYNGIYHCEDTGRLIKGYKIDLFLEDTGEKVSKKAMDFGVTKAKITLIK
jgi:3D (Asp-Asp-Asp) domain-containing protein